MSADEAKPKESKRKQVRYAVTDDCRLRASIQIRSSDSATAKKDWSGTLVDLSAGGAHIQISLNAVAYKGDSCVLKLSHGGAKIDLRGTLVHYVCSARNSVCGVGFDFTFEGADRAYQPFLHPIMASASLKAGEKTAETGRHREEYNGPGQTKLVVWRDHGADGSVVAFDYMMSRYGAVLTAAGPDMARNKAQVSFRGPTPERGIARLPLTPEQEVEARWEFSLAASNLPVAISADIRKFLRLVS